ncbi:CDP-glycerol:glycerophosphate glycerophosphotransferase [Alkalicoccobacillus porphyridii]|uniref:Glycosyltransferase n=1 Tax=Alkalicoccobacillus porphyridii TaxID=2597270 RepID=A0A554A3W6_9BACI|nr:CDP-glycerol:glycerophosphate glycerophosphotransferase [Alkalicoccobacillus porphyridii]TSB48375.1 glycosyltransferase [Alkalicoccobacillus porphyridii]
MNVTLKKISVIITVYNKVEQVSRCIHSVLDQTYPNIELIIIDDGSTDASNTIINEAKQYAQEIKSIRFETQQGLAKARNKGLQLANGEFVFYLDADDYLLPQALSLLAVTSDINSLSMIALRVQSERNMRTTEYQSIRTVNWEGDKRLKICSRRSASSILYKRCFLIENELSFNESFHYYTDFDFIIRAANQTNTILYVDAPLYIRGECLDPVNKPSLSIIPVTDYIDEYLLFLSKRKEYSKKLVQGVTPLEEVEILIERAFLRVYFNEISKWMLNHTTSFEKLFDELRKVLMNCHDKVLKNSGRIGRLQIKAHVQGKPQKTMKLAKLRYSLSSWRKALTSRSALYQQLANHVFSKLPLKEKQVVFEAFGGRSYACNPRSIYEELQQLDPSYTCIWVFNDPSSKHMNDKTTKVKRFSLRYYYYMATSKYWIVNSRIPKYVLKREGTIYVQTWHGTPLKRLASDMKEVYMPGTTTTTYKLNFYHEAGRWDYLLSPNAYSSEIFKRAFHYKKNLLEVGYPRNDLFFDEEKRLPSSIQQLKRSLELPPLKKVILYAPTWRDDEYHRKGEYRFDLQLDLHEMKRSLGESYIVLLRMHYLIADKLSFEGLEDFAFNLSDHEDIAELYLLSDLLVTDYSSVFFDYAILNKPILFYTYDLDKYQHELRGFYFDLRKEAPGPLLKTTEEIIHSIKDLNKITSEYQERRDQFRQRFCHLDDGQSSHKILKEIFK